MTELLDFMADWCVPCKSVEPILARLAREYTLVINKINVDQQIGLAERYEISGLPTVIILVDQKPRVRLTGNKITYASLKRALDELQA